MFRLLAEEPCSQRSAIAGIVQQGTAAVFQTVPLCGAKELLRWENAVRAMVSQRIFRADAVFWVLRVYMKFLSSIFYRNICFFVSICDSRSSRVGVLEFVLYVAYDLAVEEVDDSLCACCILL